MMKNVAAIMKILLVNGTKTALKFILYSQRNQNLAALNNDTTEI